jgi:hypothetical protein
VTESVAGGLVPALPFSGELQFRNEWQRGASRLGALLVDQLECLLREGWGLSVDR